MYVIKIRNDEREVLIKKLDLLNVKCCFNNQEYNFDKLKFIIIGDNPWETEFDENIFYLLSNNLSSNFDNECIIPMRCKMCYFIVLIVFGVEFIIVDD